MLTRFLALASTLALISTTQALAEVTIEETLLSPLGQGFSYTPSPAPADLATVGPAGSRMAVYYNGEPGPKFDEIIATQPTPEGGGGLQIMFSPDGSRIAYAGRKRDKFTLIIDDQEVATGLYDGNQNSIEGIGFTPDSQHYFYRLGKLDENGARTWSFVMDGVPSPALSDGRFQALVSPVGNGYVLIGTLKETGEQVMIRDGSVVDARPTKFMYSPDGRLYTLEHDSTGNQISLKLDGQALYTGAYSVHEIILAPEGESWAMIGHPHDGQDGPRLILNGEVIEGRLLNLGMQKPFQFSPDGSRWSAIMMPDHGRQYAVIDGEEGDEYQSIESVTFSPDSQHVSYWGRSPSGAFFVIDGEEQNDMAGVTPPAIYGGGGDHIVWHVQNLSPSSQKIWYDDIPYVPTQQQFYWTTANMSHDGSRLAFLENYTVHELTADGVIKHEGIRVHATGQSARGGFTPLPKGTMFSPDNKYLVYYGTHMQSRSQGIFFNDKRAIDVQGSAIIRIGFSNDGNHLFVILGVGNGRALLVDGETVMQFAAQPFESDENMWHIDDTGVLHFLLADNEGIKRVTVTPSSDKTVHDLISE
ncbi:MAG: hypothetical protein ACF8GE_07025 [Phycisphaerales bacterium JB043]